MTESTTARLARERQMLEWGNRLTLHPHHMVYAFSFAVEFVHDPAGGDGVAERSALPCTFHVLKRTQVETVEGGVNTLPQFRIERGLNTLAMIREAVVELSNSLWLKDEHDSDLVLRCRGVSEVPGGLRRLLHDGADVQAAGDRPTRMAPKRLHGTSFVSVRFESSEPKYRWLFANVLMGFGRVQVSLREDKLLAFALDYDLYSAV